MKFKITLKDPDGVYDAVQDAAKESVDSIVGIEDADKPVLVESRAEKFSEIVSTWFEFGEYLTVEIDTEAKTISVVPN